MSDKGEARQLFLGGENIFVKAAYANFSELDQTEIILGKYTECTKFHTSYSTAKSYMLKKIIIEGKAKLDGRNEFLRKDISNTDRRLGEELIIRAAGELVYSSYNIRFKKIQIFGKVNTHTLSADNLDLEPNSDSKISNLKILGIWSLMEHKEIKPNLRYLLVYIIGELMEWAVMTIQVKFICCTISIYIFKEFYCPIIIMVLNYGVLTMAY